MVSKAEMELARELMKDEIGGIEEEIEEAIGAEEIVGEEEIVGAVPGKPHLVGINRNVLGRLMSRAKAKKTPSAPASGGARRVVQRDSSGAEVRTKWLVLNSTPNQGGADAQGNVPAGGSCTMTAKCNTLFDCEYFIIHDEFADDFVITDMKFGNRSIKANEGGLIAAAFVPTANLEANRLDVRTMQENSEVQLIVQNIGTDARPFRSTILGAGRE